MRRAWLAVLLAPLSCSSAGAPDPAAALTGALSIERDPPVAAYLRLAAPPAAALATPDAPVGSAAFTARVRPHLAALELEQGRLARAVHAEGGIVVGRLQRLANALQVQATPAALARLARHPAVVAVERVPLQRRHLLTAVPAVGAPAVWAPPVGLTGRGVRIAIVDSGIDYLHADFGGPGTSAAYDANDPTRIEPGTFPTARVVGGVDFVGDDFAPESGVTTPRPDPDPLDCARSESMQISGGHGTHVAGIAAGGGVLLDGSPFLGPYDATPDGATFRIGPGMAPEASLLAYKVFGCSGSTTVVSLALERAIDPDEDGDFSDRADVVNASLGLAYGVEAVTDTEVVANLSALGTLFVVAAGNDGDASFSVASPSNTPSALSVAASSETGLFAMTIDTPASLAGDVPAAEGGFTRSLAAAGPISAAFALAQPEDACASLGNAGALAGRIAVLRRGSCTFAEKLQRIEAAGALAAVVVNNSGSAPFPMGGDGDVRVAIPGVMIPRDDGEALIAALGAGTAATGTLDAASSLGEAGVEQLAGFSSRGPDAEGVALKPELAAPGDGIDSAGVGSGADARRSSGTSMACPVVAGAAALLRQARPGWSSAEVKAALMNTAARMADENGSPYLVSQVGGGRLDIAAAVATPVTASEGTRGDGRVGVWLGSVVTAEPTTRSERITLSNRGAATVSYAVTAASTYPLPGATPSVTPSAVTVPAGGTAEVTLTLAVDPALLPAPAPDAVTPDTSRGQPRHFLTDVGGLVRFTPTGGGSPLSLPFGATVRPAGRRAVAEGCPVAEDDGSLSFTLEGAESGATPTFTSVFMLGAEHPARPTSESDPRAALLDLLAVGAASDGARAGLESGAVHFGVVIAGTWTTPARGQFGALIVHVDTDLNGSTDYTLRVVPITREGYPFGDALATVTYDRSGQETASRRFINTLSAAKAYSAPFDNSVLVLSANLADLGVTEGATRIGYRAATESADPYFADTEMTAWSTIDVTAPDVDTTAFGLEGRPAFVGADALRVVPSPTAVELPPLLVLHHTNVAGLRHQVVQLTPPGATLTAPATLAVGAGAPATVELTVENPSPRPLTGVRLTAALSGAGRLTSATATGATCSVGATITCTWPELAPAAAATVSVTLEGDTFGGAATLSAEVESAGCVGSTTARSSTTSLTVEAAAEPSRQLAGGCACTAPARPTPGAPLLAALAALGALGLRPRRRL